MYSKTLKFTVYSSLRPEHICLRQHCMTPDSGAAHSTDGMLTLKAAVTSWVAT